MNDDHIDDENDSDEPAPTGCFPSSPYPPYRPFSFPMRPDITQELLKALTDSHKAHIQSLTKCHERESELMSQLCAVVGSMNAADHDSKTS